MEDYELESEPCPYCGHEPTRSRRCVAWFCENGWVDESDENFNLPGTDMVACEECNGKGYQHWCPSCGKDIYVEDNDDENESWNEDTLGMIDGLGEFGKVVQCEQVGELFHVHITDGFSMNFLNTNRCLKLVIDAVGDRFPKIEKMRTDRDLFHLILKP